MDMQMDSRQVVAQLPQPSYERMRETMHAAVPPASSRPSIAPIGCVQ